MSTTKPSVKRTYGSQNSRPRLAARESSLEPSSSTVTAPETTSRRKRPLADLFPNGSPPKISKTSCSVGRRTAKPAKKLAKKEDGLTQLHFSIDKPTQRTCPLCGLTYTRGAVDDENLHKSHCLRVQRGMEWGREEDKEMGKDDNVCSIVEEDVALGSGQSGRIVSAKPVAGGKLGTKVSVLPHPSPVYMLIEVQLSSYLMTVNLALDAPDIPASALKECKVYLFLLRKSGCTREKIVGCVVAQRISGAMEVATEEEVLKLENVAESLVHVEDNLYCKPEELPTAMGIPRLFVSSAHRRKGIAKALLDAAARTFIHGCQLDSSSGEIAFSQPTSIGRKVMEKWGRGGVRVYRE